MPTLVITGPATAGKTSLAAALLLRLRDAGRTAAYVKPFSSAAESDADHAFASHVLAGALGIAVGPAPGPLSASVASAAAAIAELQRQHETVIVEAADGAPPARLADAADARVLEVHTYAPPQDLARAAADSAVLWGVRLAGLVVNAVPPYRQDATQAAAPDAVVIPESRVMLAPTVAQIAEHLDAVWTLEPVNADALIEHYLIGGNLMDSGPTYFGRYANQAVITRAQRPDIQMASLGRETRCLVLTGPGDTSDYVKAEARERDIPLLRVNSSTLDTADALDGILERANAHSLVKARHYAALLRDHAGPSVLDAWLADGG